jgi:TatD DNase family protein
MLLDAHTHLDMYQGTYLDMAIEEIRQLRILSISSSMDPGSYRKNREIASRCPLIIPAFGVHPWNAHHYADKLNQMEQMAEESLFLGEVGLDAYFVRDREKLNAQKLVFEYFLKEAARLDKLIIVHTKGAEEEVLEMLRRHKVRRAFIHWYSGPIDAYMGLVAEGYKFTIGFMVSHSDFIRVIARRIPREQMLLETDNPGGFEWKHGRPGMPHIIKEVAREVARLTNQSHHEIEEMAFENFMNTLTFHERSVVVQAIRKKEPGDGK